MLNFNERKVLKYLQKKNIELSDKNFNFKFVDAMYYELGGNINLTKVLLSLELGGYLTLSKQPVAYGYVSTYKNGNENLMINGITLKEEGLIYDVKYRKSLFSNFWFSFVLPVLVSICTTLFTWLLMK